MDITSCVRTEENSQLLYVNEKSLPIGSYITYFTENERYGDFTDAGCRLFTFPLFFASRTINESSQCPIFAEGIFDGEEPDFTVLDREIGRILTACPDAYIFPRVNISLPKSWEDENPNELNDTGTVKFPEIRRPCLSSDKWAEEVKRLLTLTVEHIEASDYRGSIAGYQIAGGNTEEWFSYDMKGSIGARSREKFAEKTAEGLYDGSESSYYRYLSDTTAARICEFASHIKELTGHRLAVGSFYGYTYECPFRTSVHHSLKKLLECGSIDFICSPVSYINTRKAAFDHPYMLPLDSLKAHGKLYFSENDTRTHLTKAMCDLPHYNLPIWFGPDADTSCEIMKIHFSRALIHGHSYWWFDMWGGWYADERYMKLIRRFFEIAEAAAPDCTADKSYRAEAAYFADEEAYALLSPENTAKGSICSHIRNSLGKMGLPYAKYLASDFDTVCQSCKAVILAEPVPTPNSGRIKRYCAENGIPCLVITPENAGITPSDLREFCRKAGCRVICDRDAVIYYGGRYLFIHAPDDGEYRINAESDRLHELFENKEYSGILNMKAGESKLFELYTASGSHRS